MESDLIEMAGEDDSLLQQIPNDVVSSRNTNNHHSKCSDYFLCSPLQVPRSKSSGSATLNKGKAVSNDPYDRSVAEGMMVNEDVDKTSSSCKDSMIKDNINANKAEALKLSVEIQQMKRKKRCGGYNLRKSLAWDRAFFTEEGVLNPAELSMISGYSSKSSGNILSVIEEEGPNCTSDSSDLQVLEENLFKELPATTPNKDRNASGGLLPKHCSSSTVRRNVLSVHDVNRSGSKRSGCPRPVASSSMKRPANLNTTKAVTKDSKVSKLPVVKPDIGAVSRTAKSAIHSASASKRNQITQPATNIQKSTVLKGSSNYTKNALNNAKPVLIGKSLTSKTSIGQARRNVASSAKCLSTNLQSSLITEAKNSLDVTSNPSLQSMRCASKGNDGSSKIAIPLPKNASCIGVNMQHVQQQIAKPSGLRMPSPSLGFFVQPKAPSLQSSLIANSRPCNLSKSITPSFGNLGAQNPVHELKPPLAPGIIPKVVNDGAAAGNIKVSCSNSGCSIASTVNPALLEKMESVSRGTNIQKVEKKVQYDQNSYGAMKDDQMLHSDVDMDQQFVELADPCISKMTSQMEDEEFQRNNKNCEVDLSNESRMIHSSNEDLFNKCRGPEELHPKVADICSKVKDSSAGEIQNSCASSHLRFMEKEKDDTRAVDEVIIKSCAEDVVVQSLDAHITVESSNIYLSTSIDNPQILVDDVNEKSKRIKYVVGTFVTGEQGSKDDVSNLDDCFVNANSFNTDESKEKSVLQSVESSEPDGSVTCKGEPKTIRAPYPLPLVVLDHGSNLDQMEYKSLEDTTAESKPVVENYKLGSQFQHDREHHDQPTFMELENMNEDQLTEAVRAKDVEVTCPKSRHFNGSELDGPFLTSKDLEDKEFNLSVKNSCPNSNLQPGDDFFPFHEDNAKEQIDMFRAKMNVNIGNNADVNSKEKGCGGSVLENPNGLSVHKHTEQANKETDGANSMTKESLLGDELVQSCNDIFLVDSRSSHKPPSAVNNQYSVDSLKENKQSGYCEIENSGDGIEQVCEDNVPGFCLNATLLANNKSEEFREENVFESAFEQCDGLGNEPEGYNGCAQAASLVQDGCLGVNRKAEYLQMEIAVTDSIDIEPSVENLQCYTQSRHENELSSQATSMEFDLSKKVNNNQISRDPFACNSMSFSLDGELESSNIRDETSSSGSALQSNNANVLRDKTLPSEAENTLAHNSRTLNSELQHELENTIPTDDIDARTKLEKSGNEKKRDTLSIKPPLNAVPFSDEWLAAFEAAGEEILTMKSGAVQHSPPDKSQPEPGPWSPVKRKKAQVIGPYDCTKYSNTASNVPPPSPH